MTTLTTTDVTNGTTADGNVVNTNFGNVRSVVNGNIDNANIAASAAIAVSKLAAGSNGQYLQVVGGQASWAAGPSGSGVVTGSLVMYIGTSAPSGYLLCDGSAVSRTTYADLFALCGTAYGAGDGSSTFNLPDMRGRMAVGKGTNTDIDALGENEGESTVGNRRPKHKHTVVVTDPGHTHSVRAYDVTGGGTRGVIGGGGTSHSGSGDATSSTTGISATVGPTSSVPTDGPAYLTVNFIVKY